MAIAVVNKKQTGAAATATLTLAAEATAGNILVAFISKNSVVSNPTVKDDLGATWTLNETKAAFSTSSFGVWVATKKAAGKEKELVVTANSGAVQGISYFELSGATSTVDVIVHTDNQASGKTITSPSTTTTEAGDIVLAGVGLGAESVVGAWSGTNALTNVETASTRCFGGSLIPAKTLSGETFTANWTTARVSGILLVAFKAESSGVTLAPTEASAATSTSMAASSTRTLAPEAASASTTRSMAAVATEFVQGTASAVTSSSLAASAPVTIAPAGATAVSSATAAIAASTELRPTIATGVSSSSAAVIATAQLTGSVTATTLASATLVGGGVLIVPSAATAVSSATASLNAVIVIVPVTATAETHASLEALSARLIVPSNANAKTSATLTISVAGAAAEPPTSAKFEALTSSATINGYVTFATFEGLGTSAKVEATPTTAVLSGG